MSAPPPYNPQYAQQQPPPPVQQGYVAPPGPPPQQGYGQAPPNQGYPAPTYPPQSSTQNQTIVVTQPAPATVTTTYVHEDKPNHLLHCIITFFCPWWIFVWICLCCIKGC